MLSLDMFSIHRQLGFALDAYCATKRARILFCLPLSCIAAYRDMGIVYRTNRCVSRYSGAPVYLSGPSF